MQIFVLVVDFDVIQKRYLGIFEFFIFLILWRRIVEIFSKNVIFGQILKFKRPKIAEK